MCGADDGLVPSHIGDAHAYRRNPSDNGDIIWVADMTGLSARFPRRNENQVIVVQFAPNLICAVNVSKCASSCHLVKYERKIFSPLQSITDTNCGSQPSPCILLIVRSLTTSCSNSRNPVLFLAITPLLPESAYVFRMTKPCCAAEDSFDEANSFREKRAVVKRQGYYGFIDIAGNIAIKPRFTYTSDFFRGTGCHSRREISFGVCSLVRFHRC